MDSERSCCIQECDNKCQDIVAFKIFDQCKTQECESLGPVISRENCECVILPPCGGCEDLGRIILPGCPITAPQCTAFAKVMKNSFCLTNADIVNINPSPLKKGCWNADIIYYFDFTLQLFDMNMRPLKIVCCPTTLDEMERKQKEKFLIKAQTYFRKQVILYGGEKPSEQIFSNMIFGSQKFNDPFFLVQATAYPMDVTLKDPCCTQNEEDSCRPCVTPVCPPKCQCQCCEPCHDAYCEPFFYIFIEICLEGTVKLVRFTCREIQTKPCAEPKKCEHCPEDPHKFFDEMKFPSELFLPQK